MSEFHIDLKEFNRAMKRSPELVGNGAIKGLKNVKENWVIESRNVAPLASDGGNLRRQLKGDINESGIDSFVEVESNATQDTGGSRFNYAYYIHEGHMASAGKSLQTPGTIEEFIKKPRDDNKEKYKQMLVDSIKAEMKKGGW